MSTDQRTSLSKGERTTRFFASGLAVLALLALAGWLVGFPSSGGVSGQVTMKTSTLVGLAGVPLSILAVTIWFCSLRFERAMRAQRQAAAQSGIRLGERTPEMEQVRAEPSHQLRHGSLEEAVRGGVESAEPR